MAILPSTVLAALLPVLLLFSWPPLLASYGGSPGGYGSPGFGTAGFVYRCPVTAMAPLGYMSPYGVTYCGTGSLFHYYVCCDYNPTECCLQLEPWVIIGLVIVGILGLLLCIGCCALCFLAQRK